jgi:hypothetical protein
MLTEQPLVRPPRRELSRGGITYGFPEPRPMRTGESSVGIGAAVASRTPPHPPSTMAATSKEAECGTEVARNIRPCRCAHCSHGSPRASGSIGTPSCTRVSRTASASARSALSSSSSVSMTWRDDNHKSRESMTNDIATPSSGIAPSDTELTSSASRDPAPTWSSCLALGNEGRTRYLAHDLRSRIRRSRHDAWASPNVNLVFELLDDGDGAVEEILTLSCIYLSNKFILFEESK